MGYEQLLGEIEQQQTQIGEAKKTHEKESGRYKSEYETWLDSRKKARKEITSLEGKIKELKQERYKQKPEQQIYTSKDIKSLYGQLGKHQTQLGQYKAEGVKTFAKGKTDLESYQSKVEKAEEELKDYESKILQYQKEGYTPEKTDKGWSFSKQVVTYKTVQTGGGGGGTPEVSMIVHYEKPTVQGGKIVYVKSKTGTSNLRITGVVKSLQSKGITHGGKTYKYRVTGTESQAAPESKHYKYAAPYVYKQVPVKQTITKKATAPMQMKQIDFIFPGLTTKLEEKTGVPSKTMFSPDYQMFKKEFVKGKPIVQTPSDKQIYSSYQMAVKPIEEAKSVRELEQTLKFKKMLIGAQYDKTISGIKTDATYNVPQPGGEVYTFSGATLKDMYSKDKSKILGDIKQSQSDIAKFKTSFKEAKRSEPALYMSFKEGQLSYKPDIPRWYSEKYERMPGWMKPISKATSAISYRIGNVDLAVKSLRGELPGTTPGEVEKSISAEHMKWEYGMAKKQSVPSMYLHSPAFRNVVIPMSMGAVLKPVMGFMATKGTFLATSGKTVAGRTLGRTMFYSPYVVGGVAMGYTGGQIGVLAKKEQLGLVPGGTTATSIGELGLQLGFITAGARTKWVTKTSSSKLAHKQLKDMVIASEKSNILRRSGQLADYNFDVAGKSKIYHRYSATGRGLQYTFDQPYKHPVTGETLFKTGESLSFFKGDITYRGQVKSFYGVGKGTPLKVAQSLKSQGFQYSKGISASFSKGKLTSLFKGVTKSKTVTPGNIKYKTMGSFETSKSKGLAFIHGEQVDISKLQFELAPFSKTGGSKVRIVKLDASSITDPLKPTNQYIGRKPIQGGYDPLKKTVSGSILDKSALGGYTGQQLSLVELEVLEQGIIDTSPIHAKVVSELGGFKTPTKAISNVKTSLYTPVSRQMSASVVKPEKQLKTISDFEFKKDLKFKRMTDVTPDFDVKSGLKSGSSFKNVFGFKTDVHHVQKVGQGLNFGSISIQGLRSKQETVSKSVSLYDQIFSSKEVTTPYVPPPPTFLKKGGEFSNVKSRSYKPKSSRKKKMITPSFSSGILAEPFRFQHSQAKFRKATHPKVTGKLVGTAFKTGFKVPTVELMKDEKKSKKKSKKKKKKKARKKNKFDFSFKK